MLENDVDRFCLIGYNKDYRRRFLKSFRWHYSEIASVDYSYQLALIQIIIDCAWICTNPFFFYLPALTVDFYQLNYSSSAYLDMSRYRLILRKVVKIVRFILDIGVINPDVFNDLTPPCNTWWDCLIAAC